MIRRIPAPSKTVTAFLALASDPAVLEMRQYMQHRDTDTYQHCRNVAMACCWLGHKLRCKDRTIDAAMRAAMLHDFYLYDYHGSRRRDGRLHAWSHPETALENASRKFDLNEVEKNAIRAHMFPTTLLHAPRYAASWLVSCMDKLAAVCELIRVNPFRDAYLVPA